MAASKKVIPPAEINLVNLIERFRGEDRCRAYLKAMRWPQGVACVRCGSLSISRVVARGLFECNSCRHQFSVTAGTSFHGSHLPLWKWFLTAYMMTESRKGISANQIKRTISVSYKTAWYLCHRIRTAMHAAAPPLLTGTVEVDETFIGGKVKGRGRGYRGIADENTRHETVNHRQAEYVRGDVQTNGIENVWSLLDRSIMGAFHHVSAKHLDRYLDERSFRFNNRENMYLFRDTIRELVTTDALPYRDLTAETPSSHPKV